MLPSPLGGRNDKAPKWGAFILAPNGPTRLPRVFSGLRGTCTHAVPMRCTHARNRKPRKPLCDKDLPGSKLLGVLMEIEQFYAGRANAHFSRCGSSEFPYLFPYVHTHRLWPLQVEEQGGSLAGEAR